MCDGWALCRAARIDTPGGEIVRVTTMILAWRHLRRAVESTDMPLINNAVSTETRGDVGLLLINSPPVNALSHAVREGLVQGVAALNADPAVKAIVLACRGRTFCAGADVAEFGKPKREPSLQAAIAALEASAKPIVAAMHGTVMGGGLEIALACHYRVAAPTTRFALPEVTLGIIPGAGGTQRLPRLIGAERALDFILSAKPVGTRRRKTLGFLDDVIDGDLRAGAIGYARAVLAAGKGPRRTGAMKVDSATATDEIFQR